MGFVSTRLKGLEEGVGKMEEGTYFSYLAAGGTDTAVFDVTLFERFDGAGWD